MTGVTEQVLGEGDMGIGRNPEFSVKRKNPDDPQKVACACQDGVLPPKHLQAPHQVAGTAVDGAVALREVELKHLALVSGRPAARGPPINGECAVCPEGKRRHCPQC